jgi:hypothetical protein
MFEADLIPIICALLLGGESELRVSYEIYEGPQSVRIDCLTETHAIEIGLDGRRSSYDSVHQAIFYGYLTEREPMVILVDTDGEEDNTEYQVRTVAQALGVDYRVYDLDYLIRYQMTSYLRARNTRPSLSN